jgi:hypothetical protein
MNEQVQEKCSAAINLINSGRQADAAILFTEILNEDRNIPLAWNNRGLCLLALGHPFDAVLNIEKAIALQPEEPSFHNNIAAAHFDQLHAEAALVEFNKAIELKADFPEALMNKGNVLKFQGDLPGALDSYRLSIKARPDYADAHLHLSFAALMAGLYEEGWKEFEWRWKTSQLPSRGLPFPDWNGEDLTGKKLLIYAEQGHGDALQFVRYAPIVKKMYDCTVLVEVRQPLTRLIKSMGGFDDVITYGERGPDDIDYVVAMMSLPRILGTTVETIPWSGPYFKADPFRVSLWAEQLKKLPPGLKVGVCWAGMSRPGNPNADSVDKKRSTTLASFAPVAAVPGVSWVSLQKGPPSEQVNAPPRGMTIGDWTCDLDDFYDTAALIENCDLVISVDTAVLHVAAAMGKPTWLLSRWDTCWRWLGQRTDSPWYPTIRQFWQPQAGAWEPMMQEVALALQQYVKERSLHAA